MWEDIIEGEVNVEWLQDALINGIFWGITDGSYDREKALTVNVSGLIVGCMACHQILRGSFFEISTKANLYRGIL